MQPILGIDTETTGVSNEDEVIQVAAILVDPVDFQILDRFETLVKADRPIHPKAQEVHGISAEMLQDKPTMQQVWQDSTLSGWVQQSSVVLGHNVVFDIRMLKHPAISTMSVVDTLPIVRTLFPTWRNHKLGTCVEYLELPEFKAHDALADVEVTAKILQRLSQDRGLTLQDFITMSGRLKQHYLDLVKKRFV